MAYALPATFWRLCRCSIIAILALQVGIGIATSAEQEADFFEQHIRPVLVEHCYSCHSRTAEDLEAGLRLDSRSGALQGGESGQVIQPGNADASLLIRALRYDDGVSAMPPDRKLADDVVERFTEWVNAGAVMPVDAPTASLTDKPESQHKMAASEHWAFQAPQRARDSSNDGPDVTSAEVAPANAPPDHGSNPTGRVRFDTLVENQLALAGLKPAPSATRASLAKRLHYDLLGLPPTYAWVQAFEQDKQADAYERRIEELLASPQFGERWARHWLDVARFADTKGYVFTASRDYPDAHKYREWVIRAFNEDRPFDEFLLYQLAADQLAGDAEAELAAMGFLTLGRRFLGNQHDIIDDRIDVTTRGLMGLTVTCARCHDHKYDPIPAADYYSLYGVFRSSEEPNNEPSPLRLVDAAKPYQPYVFLRGKSGRRGDNVPRQFLAVLSPQREPFQNGSGRLEMARAIASAQNPLTARVFVNRVWGQLMGQYLVDTPSDFGTRSRRPPLQPVLDDLTVAFVERGWSIKWLIRQIVTSRTYRQTSLANPTALQVDPENRLIHHRKRKRLDFESMRDALLLVSGRLDATQVGGPSINVTANDPRSRRTLYAKIDRQNFPGLFRTFDMASPDTHTPKRFETTVPQQALFLLNSPFVLSCAEAVADLRQRDTPREQQVAQLYRRILAREPVPTEIQAAEAYLSKRGTQTEHGRWADLAQVLMVSNEFFFLD